MKLRLLAVESTPLGLPPVRLYAIPADERWFLAASAYRIGLRLADEALPPQARKGLLRQLWGLQRLPLVTPGLCVGVSWSRGESHCFIHAGPESLEFTHCRTRLNYFVGAHQLFLHGATPLLGDERRQFLKDWVAEFEGIADPGELVSVEDLSTGDQVDRPLMLASHAWIDEDKGELDLP